MWETKLNASRALQSANETESSTSGTSNGNRLPTTLNKESSQASRSNIEIKSEMVCFKKQLDLKVKINNY